MRTRWLVPVLALGAGAVVFRTAFADPAPSGDSPVLVELFTSEGCSSCPPAEDLLSTLAHQPGVIPLAFHVDYWDDLGWPDRFAQRAFTDLQRAYAGAHDGRVYTPEAVVGGDRSAVGSDRSSIEALVRDASRRPLSPMDLSVSSRGAAVHATVHVGPLPEAASLRVALVEEGLGVDVLAGENRGRHLDHAPLARDFVNAGSVAREGGTFEADLHPPSGSRADHLSVVAFAKSVATGRVLALATARP